MALRHKGSISRKRIKDILILFKFLSHLNKTNKEIAIKFLSNEGIDFLSEGIYNILYNVDCTSSLSKCKQKQLIKALQPKKKLYQQLSLRKGSILSKKKKILQTGTGLPLLLSTAIPFLANLLLPKK